MRRSFGEHAGPTLRGRESSRSHLESADDGLRRTLTSRVCARDASSRGIGFFPLSRDTYYQEPQAGAALQEPGVDTTHSAGQRRRRRSSCRQTQALGSDAFRKDRRASAQQPPRTKGCRRSTSGDRRSCCPLDKTEIPTSTILSPHDQPSDQDGKLPRSGWSTPQQIRGFTGLDGNREEGNPGQLGAAGHTSAIALPSPSQSRSQATSTRQREVPKWSPWSQGVEISKVLPHVGKGDAFSDDDYDTGNENREAESESRKGGDWESTEALRRASPRSAGSCGGRHSLADRLAKDDGEAKSPTRDTWKALARAEALARREVEAAQEGAAAERAARAAAEAALHEARVSLQDTNQRLQESLSNGPQAALSALLAEKEAAEEKAATAAAMAEASAVEAASALKKRKEELRLSKKSRDQVQQTLERERSDAEQRTQTLRSALAKARGDALNCRARASTLRQRLDRADISGLQATMASLAADKAAAQSRAAELEAKLAHETGANRRRAHASRKAVASANDQLSSAEIRASAAEARVEAIVRHLTVSERRRREAERRAAEGVKAEGAGMIAIEAADESVTQNEAPRHRRMESTPVGMRSGSDVCPGSKNVGGEWLGCRSRLSGTVRKTAAIESRSITGTASSLGDGIVGSRNQVRDANATSTFVDESRQRYQPRSGNNGEEITAERHPEDVVGAERSPGEGVRGGPSETQAARQKVADAKQEVAAFRPRQDRGREQAAETTMEATIEKERVVKEAEQLGPLSKDAQEEMCALRGAFARAGATNQAGKYALSLEWINEQATAPDDELQSGEPIEPESKRHGDIFGKTATTTTGCTTRREAIMPARGQRQETRGTPPSAPTVEEKACSNAGFPTATSADAGAWVSDPEPGDDTQTEIVNDGACRGMNDVPPYQRTLADGLHVLEGETKLPLRPDDPLDVKSPPPELSWQAAIIDTRIPAQNLGDALQASRGMTPCRQAREHKIEELEGIISESEKQHALFRERGERRLEALRLAYIQEEEEEGSQLALMTLVEEKMRVETRASELELRLGDMTVVAMAARGECDRLRVDIEEDRKQHLAVNPEGDPLSEEPHQTVVEVIGPGGVCREPRRSARPAQGKHSPVEALPGVTTLSAGTMGPGEGVSEKDASSSGSAPSVAGRAEKPSPTPSALPFAEGEEGAESAELDLRAARDGSFSALEERQRLKGQLGRALSVKGEEAEGKRLAQERIAELEKGLQSAEVEQERMRERAEARLASLRTAFEQEEAEADGKAALGCLLDEKTELVLRAANLEARLREAETATAAALDRAAALTQENAVLQSGPPSATPAEDVNNAYGSSRHSGSAQRATIEASESVSLGGAQQPALVVQHSEITATQSIAEANRLRHELEIARAELADVAAAAAAERKTSKERVLALEYAIEDSKREYHRHRERAETRLETLRMAFDQEERENDYQATLAILLEEKGQAERRADEASAAANDSLRESKRIRERANEVIHACERDTAALRASTEANTERQTAAGIIAAIDAKMDTAPGASRSRTCGGAEPAQNEAAHVASNGGHGELVAEILRKFDTACDAVKAAEAEALAAKVEVERIRSEVDAAASSSTRTGNGDEEPRPTNVAAMARQTAEKEAALRLTEAALQTARDDVDRLERKLRRTEEAEAAGRAAAEQGRGESIRKIAQLEGNLREAVEEHENSRAQARSELEHLQAALVRSERAYRAAREASQASAAEQKAEATSAAAAAAAAAAMAAAEQRRCLEQLKEEVCVAEEAVAEANDEVRVLQGELTRTADLASASKAKQEAAERRIDDLQVALERATRDHAVFRAETQERIGKIRASFEGEMRENGAQAALVALIKEKADIERSAADDLRAAEHARSDLELRLEAATAALDAAEKRLAAAGVDLDCSKIGPLDQALKEMVIERSATISSAGGAGMGDRDGGGGSGDARAGSEKGKGEQNSAASRAPGGREPGISPGARHDVGNSESDERNANAETAEPTNESHRSEVDRARVSEAAVAEAVSVASEARTAAEKRVLELEDQIEQAAHEHYRSRALAEARLQEVERRLSEEDRESGSEMAMVALLHEKAEAERRAVDIKQRLDEASSSAITLEARATALEVELATVASERAVEQEEAARAQAETTSKARTEATKAAELATIQDCQLREATGTLETTRGEMKKLREELGQALARERDASAAVEEERREAREKILELERAIERSERDHALLQERTEGRLEKLRLAVEAEERENDPQAAFSELVQDKARADDYAAKLAKSVVEIRADLEQKLECANEALRVAEARARNLESDLQATESRAAAAANTAGKVAAEAAAASLSRERALHSERLRAVVTQQAKDLEKVEATTKSGGEEEVEHWKGRAERARAEEVAARDEATAARSRISELEGAMEQSRREHESFRERTERRLESLKLAVEEEEQEQGAQVALSCLLHEKSEAQAEVADLKAQLFQASEAILTTERNVGILTTELERVRGLNSELLMTSAVVAPAAAEASLGRERLEAGLEGLRVAVEEEERGVQASLTALLEEKWELESRVIHLERQLEEAHEVVSKTHIDSSKMPSEPRLSAASVGENATAESATGAAEAAARANDAEKALLAALKTVADLETRCATAQARELQVTHEAAARVGELVRELEEANNNGSKAALVALLEDSAARSSSAIAATAEGPHDGADDPRVCEGNEDDARSDQVGCSRSESEGDIDRASPSLGEENSTDHAPARGEGGTILCVLAQRDALLRDKERLEREAEDVLYTQHDQAYRRTIDVGRYELSLDILEGNLEHAKGKLAESVQLRRADDGHIQERFRTMCQRAKDAELAKLRANEQLAEVQDQLILACQALSGEGAAISSNQDLRGRPSSSGAGGPPVVDGEAVVPLLPPLPSAARTMVGNSVAPPVSSNVPFLPNGGADHENNAVGEGESVHPLRDSGTPKKWRTTGSEHVKLRSDTYTKTVVSAAAAAAAEGVDKAPENLDELKGGVIREESLKAVIEDSSERDGDSRPPPPLPLSAPGLDVTESAPTPDATGETKEKLLRAVVGRMEDRVVQSTSAACTKEECADVVESCFPSSDAAGSKRGSSRDSVAEKTIGDGPQAAQAFMAGGAVLGKGGEAEVAETAGRGDAVTAPSPPAAKRASALARGNPSEDDELIGDCLRRDLEMEKTNVGDRSEQNHKVSAYLDDATSATAHTAVPAHNSDADRQLGSSLQPFIEVAKESVARGETGMAARDRHRQGGSPMYRVDSSVTQSQRSGSRSDVICSTAEIGFESARATSAGRSGTRQNTESTSGGVRRPSATSGSGTSGRGDSASASGTTIGGASSELRKPAAAATGVAMAVWEIAQCGSSVQASDDKKRVRTSSLFASEKRSSGSDSGMAAGNSRAGDDDVEAGRDLHTHPCSTEDGRSLTVATWPASSTRRRRSSDALFGLPRLSSMYSMPPHQRPRPAVLGAVDASESRRRSSSYEFRGHRPELALSGGAALELREKGHGGQSRQGVRPRRPSPSLESQGGHLTTTGGSKGKERTWQTRRLAVKAGGVKGAADDAVAVAAEAIGSVEAGTATGGCVEAGAVAVSAAAAAEANAAAGKSSRKGRLGQPHSASSSPESRGVSVVTGVRVHEMEGGKSQERPSAAVKLGATASSGETTREPWKGQLDPHGSPLAPFATRREIVASGETSPARGRRRFWHHQPGDRSLSAPPVKHDNAASCGEICGETSGSGPGTAAAVVREGSSRGERGRRKGFLFSLQRAVTNSTFSKKHARNGWERARSESPKARR